MQSTLAKLFVIGACLSQVYAAPSTGELVARDLPECTSNTETMNTPNQPPDVLLTNPLGNYFTPTDPPAVTQTMSDAADKTASSDDNSGTTGNTVPPPDTTNTDPPPPESTSGTSDGTGDGSGTTGSGLSDDSGMTGSGLTDDSGMTGSGLTDDSGMTGSGLTDDSGLSTLPDVGYPGVSGLSGMPKSSKNGGDSIRLSGLTVLLGISGTIFALVM